MMSKFSFEPTPRPPETTLLALCRSGRSLLPCFSSTKRVCVGSAASMVSASTGALLAPLPRQRPGGRADRGDHGVGGVGLDRDDRVAGVDRALERVRGLDAHHVADLGHAEQGGDARGDVLAERGGGHEHVAVAGGGLGNLRRQHGGQRMRVLGAGDGEHAAHAVDLRRLGGDRVDAVGEHQHVDRFALHRDGGAHRARGGGVEFAAEVFGDDQDLAHVCLRSFFVGAHPVGDALGWRVESVAHRVGSYR